MQAQQKIDIEIDGFQLELSVYQLTKVGESNNDIGFERFDAANYLKNYMANNKITDTTYGLRRIDEDPDNFYSLQHDFHQVAEPQETILSQQN